MKRLIKSWKPALLGFAYVMCAAAPVLADDTEIYFGTNNANVKNNILFVVDTSGSMSSLDGDSTTRIDELKAAFKSLLQGLDNVNVGLMRFSNPGGPVLYPVSNINALITTGTGDTGTVNKTVLSANDDGYQQNLAGTVELTTQNLEMGTVALGGASYYVFSQQIANGNNDADGCISDDSTNRSNGFISIYSASGCTGNVRAAGVRFETVNIPKPTGAAPVIIDSAYLEFKVSGTGGTAPIAMTFSGEVPPGPGTFSTSTNSRKPTVRLVTLGNTTAAKVNWNIASLPATNTTLASPDISAIVQQIVDNGSWASGSAMTFLYRRTVGSSATGRADFYSADSSAAAAQAPRLVINYHVGTGTPSTPSTTTAVRFTDINIPRHATVTNAYLEFTAASSLSDITALNVVAESSGNSTALATTANNITSRTSTSAIVPWGAVSTPAMTSWVAGTAYQTPELKAVVQELVNRSDWCGGNAMTFMLSGTGHRIAAAYDAGSATAPKLVVTYDPSSVPTDGTSCKKASLTRQISAGSDDAQEDNDTSAANLTNGTLNLAAQNSLVSRVGLRFTNIALPKNATIQTAYLQFQANNSDSSALNLTINGEKTDDAVTFASADNNISGRTKTSATVNWNSVASWTSGNTYLSPDISAVVQELVNRSGWVRGNDMAFVIDGTSTSSRRRAYSYNGSQGKSPKLIINYTDNGAAATGYTVKDKLIEIVDSLSPSGMTPLQDTFYEGVQYFRGQPVNYGKVRGAGPYAYTRVSHPDSMVAGSYTSITPSGCQDSSSSGCASETINGSPVYKSPITYACQANHIVLLTDGLPNSDNSTLAIKSLIGGASSCAYPNAGECVPDLATWVNKTADISSAGSGSANLNGKQSLVVDTIAFYQDADGNSFLEDTAVAGGGLYQVATGSDDLLAALQKVSTNTISENTSFVAAGAAVNAFNRTLNRDDLYFSVFKPDNSPKWPGNLKKYKLAFDSSGNPVIKDANGTAAVDTTTGFFTDTSRSFWSASADGPIVTKGGAGALITDYSVGVRKLYTNVGAVTDLADPGNELATANTLLTKTLFGATAYSDTQFADLIDWTRGKNVKNEKAADGTTPATRFVFADPLHSRPVAITYGGTAASPDITIFVASNSGVLHAVDDDDGREVFGFLPKELLSLQKTLYDNVQGTEHPSGLDGSITPWVIDPDGDGLVLSSGGTIQSGNKVLLTVGMRRGGRNYYGLDATDRAHPKLTWTILGGTTTGFAKLGQTWSQPTKARIRVGGTTKRVLVIGGGYDPAQDTATTRQPDSMGAAVYIIDAETGALIWSGGKGSATEFSTNFDDMLYGIPSTVTGADVSGDGLMDYFFVGDMGGQVWRFDINNGAADASTLVKGAVIADLGVAGGANIAANNRRFYHAPTLFAGDNNGTPYLGVAIGSGWRAHPLSEDTTDKFYVIRQTDIFSAPLTYAKITESDLYNADANLIKEGTADQQVAAGTALATKKGWFITMGLGEKVLSTPIVINGEVLFDTYQPSVVAGADPCVPQTGTNRTYGMLVTDASPSKDYNSDGGFTADERSQVLTVPGILDGPKLTCTADGCASLEGTSVSQKNLGSSDDIHRIYWYENRTR